MDRPTAISLGLSALVLGAVASTHQSLTLAPTTPKGRPPSPSTARRAYAVRPDVPILQAPAANAPRLGTLGQGIGILVSSEELSVGDYLSIVREWVNEDGSRTSRELGWVLKSDIAFSDPGTARSLVGARVGGPSPRTGGVDAGECDAPLHFFGWPKQVDDFKRQLDRVFDDTDATVQNCAKLSQIQKNSFAAFLAEWKTFAGKPTDTFGSYDDWKRTCTYAKQLDARRVDVIAKAACEFVGPTTIHGYEVPVSAQETLGSIASIVKWSAIGLGGTLLFITIWPEIRAVMGRGRRS